ncbi:transmembrane channel-like protein 6 isoform X1 [Gopherus evgoodei]|uniref:Transmembrane channel-like protein n=2 Tax=Gopherus evgoodei TaxID=1825980 RepID=A0A8C4Y5Y0_9SAUR|nr:transmembrane channel-like protein 6 isoform X1 [Gopherus evgoodei]XP_030390884.1 transmembrane channel-like protein 6 isoform X1 [Gopherus evgoodei]XP_030390885.1 transmembrane channel-like protein 6 isoform X1 [Gopherus evgoodei]XP_030390886.1 transmembrane channel-like protein 6 isoform X1 [Gopherus evgoodei]XP_030390888.1 transmembrane channel-like protein 6 isoform X1 [Gopherus evgoodei]XP_030390889.1 transmembrane channel-like protein 6 isoform X1 [Gopherus evgoodei]XP_030390890.1 tr
MTQPVSFTLHVPESRDGASPDLSLCDESAVHNSFQQLLQEQSMEEPELELEELELQELTLGGRENLAAGHTEAWEEPESRREHPDFSSATLLILANMPSRTIGRSRGAIISQFYNRTVKLRRRSSRPPLRQVSRSARPSLRQYDLELDSGHAEQKDTHSLLVKELQSLSSSQRSHMLQAMPVCLAEKRSLRQELGGHRSTLRKPDKTRRPLSCCGQLKHVFLTGFRSLWDGFLSLLHSLQPWHHSLKQISGRFGSSVLSYFLFLKTLLMFNIFLFLTLLIFVVATQAAYPPATKNSRLFTGLELLTGAGSFTQTLMYYGYYSNFTLNDACTPVSSSCQPGRGHLPYNMPLAYVFTIGVSFFITCILLVYSMSRSFGESYRVGSTSGDFAIKVFCAWDYKVIQRRSVRLQNENIRTQLKELLGEQQSKSRPMSLCRKLGRMVVLSLAWAVSVGTVVGCIVAVYYFAEHMLKVHRDSRDEESSEAQQEALLLALPVVVSLMNLVMPYLYNLLAAWEKQESPALEVYVAIFRNLILKMIVLGLLCYHWLSRKMGYSTEDNCWETSVGQELYRFVVMDFVFTLLDTFLGELLWRLILEKRLMRKQRPEFDIARNVLELIYGQTLTWLGVLFCPLLPAVQILKLVLLFYIKKTSLMKNCQSPSKLWRASHMSTVFITLLCFPSFLGAAIFLSYTIWAVKPSIACGPFRMQETIYESGKTWIQELEKSSPNITWFTWIHQHLVENTFFLFFVSGVLLAVIYLHIQVVKGHRRIICLLKEQIAHEGEDKVFLIQKLQCIYGKQETCP